MSQAVSVDAPLDLAAVGRRWRGPLLLVAVGTALVAVLTALGGAPPARPLDPSDPSPVGARALAELLRQHGVDVAPVSDVRLLSPGAGELVVVVAPASLSVAALEGLARSPSDLLLVEPAPRELSAVGLDAQPVDEVDRTAEPKCALPEARAAGRVQLVGTVYRPRDVTFACYPGAGGAALLVRQLPGRRVMALGSGVTFDNSHLAHAGNAALGLDLLGSRPTVDWIVPQRPTLTAGPRKGVLELLPSRLLWALLELLFAVVLLALWRGRRLGPVVAEPLPVVVRSVETVEGRARLLRAARARGRAAEALRRASRTRLSASLGLGASPTAESVVDATSAHSGRAPAQVHALLYGADPPDDASLVRLASDLDRLETETYR